MKCASGCTVPHSGGLNAVQLAGLKLVFYFTLSSSCCIIITRSKHMSVQTVPAQFGLLRFL